MRRRRRWERQVRDPVIHSGAKRGQSLVIDSRGGKHPRQPFQIADRYQSSVVNAYFDVLIKYGDEVSILNFGDLIQVDQTPFGVDVSLSNLEYDLTSAVKKT